jgi:hypothetical protein
MVVRPSEVLRPDDVDSENEKRALYAYCFICRAKVVMKGPFAVEKIGSTRDLPALRGYCPLCDKKVYRIFTPENEAKRDRKAQAVQAD